MWARYPCNGGGSIVLSQCLSLPPSLPLSLSVSLPPSLSVTASPRLLTHLRSVPFASVWIVCPRSLRGVGPTYSFSLFLSISGGWERLSLYVSLSPSLPLCRSPSLPLRHGLSTPPFTPRDRTLRHSAGGLWGSGGSGCEAMGSKFTLTNSAVLIKRAPAPLSTVRYTPASVQGYLAHKKTPPPPRGPS